MRNNQPPPILIVPSKTSGITPPGGSTRPNRCRTTPGLVLVTLIWLGTTSYGRGDVARSVENVNSSETLAEIVNPAMSSDGRA